MKAGTKRSRGSAEVPLGQRDLSVASVFLAKAVRQCAARLPQADFGGFRFTRRTDFSSNHWDTGDMPGKNLVLGALAAPLPLI